MESSLFPANPLKEQILKIGERVLGTHVVAQITPLETLRFLAVEAFRLGWDDKPAHVGDCAIIRRGLELCREHGEIPFGATSVPEHEPPNE
jgi:hypothetical protein